ncbi:DUF6415 family natural product biosynthesis protein [Streptomyces vinaceus]|uniref:DUF6415 family natural product biosynthesis protein n=1 Tax=Streptomyces vinaceus TaxID=1960 RepID=UPI003806F82C
MSGYYSVVHDPEGRLGHELPLDREPHLRLAALALTWTPKLVPPAADTALTLLELTGHARLLRDELAGRADRLPSGCELRQLLACTLAEAARRLSAAASSPYGDLAHAQSHACLVQALYTALDRLEAEHPVSGSCSHTRPSTRADEDRRLDKG